MKQTTKNIKSNFDYTQDLDFVFETTGLAILVEDEQRNITLTNTLFCNLFDINIKYNKLINTNSEKLFTEIKNCFTEAEHFINNADAAIKNASIITSQKFMLINGKTITQDYIPLYKDNSLKGHIWIYKLYQPSVIESIASTNFQLENALHVLPNEIAIYNTNLQIIFTSKAYINSNEKRNWAKGKTLQQYFSYANLVNDIAIEREKHFRKTIATQKPVSWHESNSKDGTQILRTCYPVFDDAQKINSIIEFSMDISKQKSLEEKLQQAVEHFYNILNNANNVVLQTDDKLQLQFLNQYWQTLTGQSVEQLTGKSVFNILEVTHYELYQKVFSILNGNTKNEHGIISFEDKEKNIKQLQYNLQRGFSVDNEPSGVVATLSDVTAKKMQEAQLLELIKKEKELNELKTAFVNMVSHELRTPLTVISSSAEILELMLQNGKGYSDVSIYTQQIIDEVEKMTSFMQDLLMISKIEAGKIIINPSSTNIVKFVESIAIKGFAPYKDGRVATVKVKRSQQSASIDTTLLEHCLHNILANAFKYSVGKLSPFIRVGFSKNYFTISVVDYGIGIPKQDTQKLFTSFFRASNTGNIAGTGIGLMVAKYFTEQHKGYVTFRSKPNEGSIFTIKLPYSSNE